MKNGFDGRSLAEKFSDLDVSAAPAEQSNSHSSNNHSNNNDSNLFQVLKAVEAAEATIKQQVEENNRLRIELQKKIQKLEKYKVDEPLAQRLHSTNQWIENDHQGSNGEHQSDISGDSEGHRFKKNISIVDSQGALVVHQDVLQKDEVSMRVDTESRFENSKSDRMVNALPGVQPPVDNAGCSQFSSPSTTSFSGSRFAVDGEYDSQIKFSGHGMMPKAEANIPNSLWKQDLVVKVQEHEDEIVLLRKHLADYSVKEAQIRSEKYVLEKRIAYMRLAFDQQQQELVDAASKALSYRQDIIEENIRLTYALQEAQQERTTFVSSLLSLLAEYSLQPPVPDAQSIVSNVKILFKHLQEKLLLTETKLKESQYQLTPWRSDASHSSFAPQSPFHSTKNGLELVPQPSYWNGNIPVSSSDAQTTADWDLPSHHQIGLGVAKKLEPDDLGRYSHQASSDALHTIPSDLTSVSLLGTRYSEGTNKQVTFREPVTNSDDQDVADQTEREPISNWSSGQSPPPATLDEPSSSHSQILPPVLEEPSPSFSEDDDPLPAIEGLQISGEAFPGQELQACGYSINGTTSCNFEWVRHLEDGSVNYIEGAKQPNYRVTADDVNTYLAIEVQPLDNRRRKGELVKVFANDHLKIICDPEMQNHIEKTLSSGHASYKVSMGAGYPDTWEVATLSIKREGYSIKCSRPGGDVITEKFSPNTTISIPFGDPSEFVITGSNKVEHHLRAGNGSADISCLRDTIVLTLRLFVIRAGERRKGKRRVLFFHKHVPQVAHIGRRVRGVEVRPCLSYGTF
ncbi:uncharacterized protein LOC111451285 isoform X3 [Cucurbita moschata]|uniref:Uncharacterized protein LOC111451285 isoform X3 n=1 Tax=Cucurbita moschata TaxID=3662 RepID=A0A6J1G6U5_CUCMO|nr:uncharacterized protein LOC111451285 isoform X3 [Cucurbita moschata]